jgi:tetratricopeptide (TPR) repeat protein
METFRAAIAADTVTTTHPSVVNKRPLPAYSETSDHASDAPSLDKAKTTDTPHSPSSPSPSSETHSPSSPSSDILYVGPMQVQQHPEEKNVMDEFASAVNAGRQFQRGERYEDAILFFRKALLCKKKSISTESPSVQVTFTSILFEVGMIHSHSRYHDPFKALEAFEHCLQMSQSRLGDDHPSVARVLYEIGLINEIMDEPEVALNHFSEAIAILLSNSMDNNLKDIWMSLSRVQALLGQTEDAQSSFNEAEKL